MKQCQRNANEGYVYVVDMDLEKFFDNVCQSKLIEVLNRALTNKEIANLGYISLTGDYLQLCEN